MIATTIEFPQAQIAALVRQMERNAKLLSKSIGSSVKFAAWSVADALRTATAISAKTRPFKKNDLASFKAGKPTFDVEGMKKGRRYDFQVTTEHGQERSVLKNKRVIIANRGLARKAWHLAQRKLGSGSGGQQVSGRTQQYAERNQTVEMNLKGDDPSVRITNALDYAAKAFKGGGPQTVSNAMERAARRLAHIIDAKVAKQMGAR